MRKIFFSGVLVLLPILITFVVLMWLLDFLDNSLLLLPQAWRPTNWLGVYIPGFGAIFSVVIIFVVGLFARNFLGRYLLRWGEYLLSKTPIVRSIYKSVKQLSDTLLSSDSKAFRQAVLINYPHPNSWAIAFVTGTPDSEITQQLGDMISVFMPTTPNPTSGFFLLLPAAHVKPLNMTVDEALRYVVSMGVVNARNHKAGVHPELPS